jgi:hypothetical protein
MVVAPPAAPNAALHLPAIAHECGIEFDLHDVCAIFRRTPYIADLKPGGKYVAKDLDEIGCVPVLMRALLDGGYLHGDCITVTGKTIAENLRKIRLPKDQDVVRPTKSPLSQTGGVVGLKGNLAPEGAIVKVAGMKNLAFTGRARCFDCEEDAYKAVRRRKYEAGDVLVIRYEGRAAPGHARDARHHGRHLRPGHGRQGRPHHRRPLLRRHPWLPSAMSARGGDRRPHRPAQGRRCHPHRCRQEAPSASTSRGRPGKRRKAGSPAAPTTNPARSGATPRLSAAPRPAPSATPAARPR